MIGTKAGWPPHTSVENSLTIIRSVFSAPEIYAVVLKETQEPIGSIGLLLKEANENQEAEIGYWIGKPYWGQGLIPEAVRCILQRGFTELNLITIWGGYYEGNNQSCKVMKKCGFIYHHTEYDKISPLGDIRTVPANPLNYWHWRMHLTLEQLMEADELNETIRELAVR